MGIVGRGGADIVVAHVAFPLGLDLGIQCQAQGGIARRLGAMCHLESQAALLKKVRLEPEGAGGCLRHLLQGAGGLGAQHHQRAGGARSPGAGQLAFRMGGGVVPRRVQQDREADVLPQDRGAQVPLADVHHHARPQQDGIEHGPSAAEGDLIGRRSRDEVILPLAQLPLGYFLVLVDVDGVRVHTIPSCGRCRVGSARGRFAPAVLRCVCPGHSNRPTGVCPSPSALRRLFLRPQFPLHSGQVAGFPGRIILCLTGFVIAVLSSTGVVIWWKKDTTRQHVVARQHVPLQALRSGFTNLRGSGMMECESDSDQGEKEGMRLSTQHSVLLNIFGGVMLIGSDNCP